MAEGIRQLIRAPQEVAGDYLEESEITRLLGLLHSGDCEIVRSPTFDARARKAFADAGAAAQGEARLAAALDGSLFDLPRLRQAAAPDFAHPAAMANATKAFWGARGEQETMKLEEQDFPSFVRFCLAYRIHCYFSTSIVAKRSSSASSASALAPTASLPRAAPSDPSGAKGALPQLVFVMGGPGAGKNTQCARIAAAFGYHHICVPTLLREEMAKADSIHRDDLATCMESGRPYPPEIVVQLIEGAVSRLDETGTTVLAGFPRTVDDLVAWESRFGGRVALKCCVYLDCPEAVMKARILDRPQSASSRERRDRGEIRAHLHHFQDEAVQILEKLAAKGTVIHRVCADRTVDEVWTTVRALLGPTVVFVMGAPGSLKRSICDLIEADFGYHHIAAGGLLRDHCRASGSANVASAMEDGQLAPSELMARLLREAMERKGWEGQKFVVSGFPRSLDQMTEFRSQLKDEVLVKFFISLDVSEGVAERRMLTKSSSGDTPETIQKRFVTYYHSTLPVIEFCKAHGVLRRIDADSGHKAAWASTKLLFGPSVVFVLGGPGAGKSTQCRRMAESFGYRVLSVSALQKEERERPNSKYGQMIESCQQHRTPVPVDVNVGLLHQAMEAGGWEYGKYLIEDFPRNLGDLEGWATAGRAMAHFSVFLHCADSTLEDRMQEEAGSKFDQAAFRTRLREFKAEVMPVVEELEAQGQLRRVDGEPGADQVWNDMQDLFVPSVVFALSNHNYHSQAGYAVRCARSAELYGYQHLSADDLLQEERERPGAELAEVVDRHLREGRPVPVEITSRVLKKAMEERGWEQGRYLVTGFPRSVLHLEGWERILRRRISVKFCLFFDCSEEAMEVRIAERGSSGLIPEEAVAPGIQYSRSLRQEITPVVEFFEKEGLLRKVDAEQDEEDVNACMQEILHWELEPYLKNQAVVLIKPHACTPGTVRFVNSFLASHRIAVLQAGKVSGAELAARGLVERQYSQLSRFAAATDLRSAKQLPLPEAGQEAFQRAFGTTWTEAMGQGMVMGAQDALQTLGKTAKELYDDCQHNITVRLARGLVVTRIDDNYGIFVINAFAPYHHECFCSGTDGELLRWLVVEFSPRELTWERFRGVILGDKDPRRAAEESIRGLIYRHWAELGLPKQPDAMDNSIHASAGPLEALRERMLWARAMVSEDPLGRLLLTSGVPRLLIEEWLENPEVEGWEVGHQTMNGPIFDCSEDCDTAAFRASAVRCAKAAGRLHSWPAQVVSKPPPLMERMSSRRSSLGASMQPGSLGLGLVAPQPEAKAAGITILHFNDVYNVEPRKKDPVGGIARFVTRVRELREEAQQRGEPEALCLFSGDVFNPSLTSTITKGQHMVPALNAVGIDAACFGNHDFDFGVDQLQVMKAQTNFPWLISNVTDKATGLPLAGGQTTYMLECGGRKVGLMGLIEREWLVTLHTLEPEDVEFEDFCLCGRRLVAQLREQGAEVIIALTHMRMPNDYLLAHEVEGLDLVLGGHDHHYEVKQVGSYGTYVLNSGTDFRDMSVVQLKFNKEAAAPGGDAPRALASVEVQRVEIVSAVQEDPEMKVFVDECIQKVSAGMNQEIGETAVDLDCRFSAIRTQETNIGNFVTDVMRQALKADMAILNSGTLRADAVIEKGPILMKDLVSILPMLDELCLLKLSGSKVLDILENGVAMYPRLEGRFPQVSGVSFTFDAANPAGQRFVQGSAMVNGEKLDPDRFYKVTTLNYLRQGKDGYGAFKDAVCLADGEQAGILPTLVRDHFLEISTLNGLEMISPSHMVKRAEKHLHMPGLQLVGSDDMTAVNSGASNLTRAPSSLTRATSTQETPKLNPMQHFAISPQVEGRIMCLNPVAVEGTD